MAELDIKISSPQNSYGYKKPLQLDYEIKNISQTTLFIAKGRIYSTKENSSTLRVLAGQIKPSVQLDYVRYIPPYIHKLQPGDILSSRIGIEMPLKETVITPDGQVRFREIELSGDITVYFVAGYGSIEFRSQSLDPLGDFLAWQKMATSNKIIIQISSPTP